MACFFTLWRSFICHDVLFDAVTYFWRTFGRHDVLWHHDVLFYVKSYILTSWRTFNIWHTFWRHDILFDVVEYLWPHDVSLTSWGTFWHYDSLFDVVRYFCYHISVWCCDVLLDVMTYTIFEMEYFQNEMFDCSKALEQYSLKEGKEYKFLSSPNKVVVYAHTDEGVALGINWIFLALYLFICFKDTPKFHCIWRT